MISNWQQNIHSFRWSQHAAQTYVKVPFFGAVSYLTLAVTPFCIAFAVVWGVERRVSYAWIGQDILVRIVLLLSHCFFGQIPFSLVHVLDWLFWINIEIYGTIMSVRMTNIFLIFSFQGIALIITVLQIVQIPNLKVMIIQTSFFLLFLAMDMDLLHSSDLFYK